jgi:GT2 family glycosyltransferase
MPPEISVVIASYNARETIGGALAALAASKTDVPFEVVVVDSSSDGTAELVGAEFPAVTLVRSERRLFPGDARNVGVRRATARILAFTDADCVVAPDWIEELARAHGRGIAAVGGGIVNANPETAVSWANYFCEFVAWLPGGASRPLPDAPTACLSVTRETFERFGPFVEGTLCSDSAFCRRLVRAGLPPQFVAAVRVGHVNVTDVRPYLGRKWRHGLAFARMRFSEGEMGRVSCLARVMAAPAVPFVLFARTVSATWRARQFRRELVRAAPLVFLGQTAWALGEASSYFQCLRRRRPIQPW